MQFDLDNIESVIVAGKMFYWVKLQADNLMTWVQFVDLDDGRRGHILQVIL